MEVMIPVHGIDFDFNSARTSPYPTAPSTPTRVGEYYFSAPTSPRHLNDFYREFDELLIKNEGGSSLAEVPFDWEEKPGKPKSPQRRISMFEDDFAFDVSGEIQRPSLSAEELFDGGVIKPLKAPPQLQLPTGEDGYSGQRSPGFSPRSHKSPLAQGKKFIRGAFSPRDKRGADPLGPVAIEDTRMREPERERGRERNYALSSSSRRATRSVSPIRVSEYQWEEEQKRQSTANPKPPLYSTSTALSTSTSKGFKWRLKDLFLFRSASDGRAMARDPLKKYSTFIRKQEDMRNVSSRSIESPGTGSGSGSRRRGNVSAHELHYKTNRAYSEDMKKKTFLPYKQGILGRLSFHPTGHGLSNGFGFYHN